MPLIILPGIIQLTTSPLAGTCMASRTAASILPPWIMPKLVAESKMDAPGGGFADVGEVGVFVAFVGYGPRLT
jgi:hypothetical protein